MNEDRGHKKDKEALQLEHHQGFGSVFFSYLYNIPLSESFGPLCTPSSSLSTFEAPPAFKLVRVQMR